MVDRSSNPPNPYECEHFIMEPGLSLVQNFPLRGINSQVNYHGRPVQLSCIIPVTVYNETAYSIVAETNGSGPIMITEKLAKPIIAKRLFIVFSSRGYLGYIKNLGFKTFSTVIDESYDTIENDHDRWTMAWNQVLYLCQHKQIEVLQEIRSIVEYNYDLLMSDHLINTTSSRIRDHIRQHVSTEI